MFLTTLLKLKPLTIRSQFGDSTYLARIYLTALSRDTSTLEQVSPHSFKRLLRLNSQEYQGAREVRRCRDSVENLASVKFRQLKI